MKFLNSQLLKVALVAFNLQVLAKPNGKSLFLNKFSILKVAYSSDSNERARREREAYNEILRQQEREHRERMQEYERNMRERERERQANSRND